MHSKDTQAFMEAAVDAVVLIDQSGRMKAVNEATSRMFGYRADELLGQNVSMLMPEPERSAHDSYVQRYLDTGEPRIIGIGREVQAQHRSGRLIPIRLSVGRVPDSAPPRFVGLIRDITAEHEAIAALKLERDRANAYLELNEDILLRLDEDYRIREINARGADLLGAPRVELHGRNWLDLMDGETERERARFMLASARARRGSREREFDVRDYGGESRRIYWRCIALSAADGTPSGWLVSGDDLTDRSRREAHAVLAQERLTRVARLASMGEMASGVAHELNQPLTAITAYARACERYLAMSEPDFAELTEAVREIGAEGLRAGRIIDRLRQLVRSDEPGQLQVLDINAVIEELRPLLAGDARQFETHLVLEFAADLPRVEGDAAQIQQVILNLVRNAFEALTDRPPQQREVRLATSRTDNGDALFSVSDNGPGIAQQMSDRLFHPFATTKKSGTGLGLAMSRTIVRSHHGAIEMAAAKPHGTCVLVRLPAAEVCT
jgi:two-component system sensor kinase FixL